LSTVFDGQPRRFCYVSAGKDECFQVSIEPPEDGIITVNAWDVETHDDAEFHRAWQVPTSALEPTLDAALRQIADWAARPRRPARATIVHVLVWIGGIWVGLVAAVVLLAAATALSKLVTGDPEWEGIVMLPVASFVAAVVASPGALLLAVGLVLRRRTNRRKDRSE
jgi:hypothetical protein